MANRKSNGVEANARWAAESVKALRSAWRQADEHERTRIRSEIIAAFTKEGYAPHDIFPYMVMIEGHDILIRYLDIIRDDLVLRRVATIAAGDAVLESDV